MPISDLIAGARRVMGRDIEVAVRKDAATRSRLTAALHPGVHALWGYRAANRLDRNGRPLAAQTVSYLTRAVTAVEIHPRASIGRGVFIDHGAGVVIGETAVIEDEVMLYHNVTVGSVGWWRPKEVAGRRHPHVRRGTVLCTGALVLGPITVGADCIVGANAVVLEDVPDGTRVGAGQVWRGVRSEPDQPAELPELAPEYFI